MSRHINFRNNGNSLIFSIGYQLADFIVCIKLSTITTRTLILSIIQLRIYLTFNTPSRIIGQVPMKIINLVQRHQIDSLFQQFYRLEVTPCIMHKSSHGINRPIMNLHIRNSPFLISELSQSLSCPNFITFNKNLSFYRFQIILTLILKIHQIIGHFRNRYTFNCIKLIILNHQLLRGRNNIFRIKDFLLHT